jgi:hypothetical protein
VGGLPGRLVRLGDRGQPTLERASLAPLRQTRHRRATSLDRYVRIAGIFRDNPVGHLGL